MEELEYEIEIDSFGENKNEGAQQIKDPLDDQFNWWYWCGVQTEEEKNDAILEHDKFRKILQDYNFYHIIRYDNNVEKKKLEDIFKKAADDDGEPSGYVAYLFDSIKQCNADITRGEFRRRLTDDLKGRQLYEMCINVIFRVYSIELRKNIYHSFLQGEDYILTNIIDIVYNEYTNINELECLVFHIYHTLFYEFKIKKMIYTMPFTSPIQDMQPNGGKIPLFIFFNWLFIVLFIKKNKNNFKKLINNKNTKQVDEMFSRTISSGGIDFRTAINFINITDFKKIIGDVLVNKSPEMFYAYIIAYWSGYEKKEGGKWDNIELPSSSFPPMCSAEDDLSMFWSMHASIKGKDIMSQSLQEINEDFKKLYSYFRENFNDLVLICTEKSFTNTKQDDGNGYYTWNFKLPRKFIKNKKIWNVRHGRANNIGAIVGTTAAVAVGAAAIAAAVTMAGGRKIKSQKTTLKKFNRKANRKANRKSNRKLNRTIKLR